MALAQYNYPQSTGLQQLGDVLLKGSGDYANIQLQRQAEERRRAAQLADLQDQRRFAVEQRGVERGYAQEDRRTNALFTARLGALERAQARGLIAASDIGNVAVEDAALAKLAQAEATEVQRQEAALANAQAELNRLASDRDTLATKDQEIAERIRKLQEDYTATAAAAEPEPVTREAVAFKAAELAKAAGVKLATTEPKRSEQLSTYTGQAEEALLKESAYPAMLAQQRLKSLNSQYNSLVREKYATSDQVSNIRQMMADLQRQFSGKIAPVRSQAPTQVLKAPVVPVEQPADTRAVATEEDRQAARDALRGTTQQPTPAPFSPTTPPATTAAIQNRIFGDVDAMLEAPPPSFSHPRIAGVEYTPQFIRPTDPTTPQQAMTRRNEAVGDAMRGAFTGATNLFRPSSWRLDNDYLVYDPPARRQAEQLQNRLRALSDLNSPTAAALKNRLLALPPLPPLTPSPQASLRSSAFYP